MRIDLNDLDRVASGSLDKADGCRISGRELKELVGIVAAAIALESVYPSRCVGAPDAKHPDNCHCGQIVLAVAIHSHI